MTLFLKTMLATLYLLTAGSVYAARITRSDARRAAAQWMQTSSAFQFALKTQKTPPPAIGDIAPVAFSSDTPNAWHIELSPQGYIVLSSDSRMTPIIAFSVTTNLDLEESPDNALFNILKQDVDANLQILSQIKRDIKLDSALQQKMVQNATVWDHLINRTLTTRAPSDALLTNVAAILSTTWNQTRYYNDLMPTCTGGGTAYNGHAPAGCGSIAAAQIFKHYNWPPRGTGRQSYSDSGTTRSTSLYHDYDWAAMRNSYLYNATYPSSNTTAISMLIRDVGYAMEMDYGCSLSASYNQSYADAANQFFYYKQCTSRTFNETLARNEISAGRPLQISYNESNGHMLVADGLAFDGTTGYLHINYGWGGSQDGWYRPSSLYGSASLDYMTPGVEPLFMPIITNTITTSQNTSFDVHWTVPDLYTNEIISFDLFEGISGTTTTFLDNASSFDNWWNSDSGWKLSSEQFFYCATNTHQGYLQTVLPIIPSSSSSLTYNYRRSLAAVNYVYVEISPDLGKTWTTIHSYKGQVYDSSPRTASSRLTAYANKPVYLRIRFRHSRGIWGWYGSSAATAGFYIDNINISNCKKMEMILLNNAIPAGTRSYTISNKYAGAYYHMMLARDTENDEHYAPFICQTTIDLETFTFKAFALTNNTVLRWKQPKPCGMPNNTVMVRRATTDYPTATTDGTQVYLGTDTYHADNGLSPGTTYYYTIWLNDGTDWVTPP